MLNNFCLFSIIRLSTIAPDIVRGLPTVRYKNQQFVTPKLFLILGGPILFWPTVSCTIDRLHGILQLPHSKNIFARQSF